MVRIPIYRTVTHMACFRLKQPPSRKKRWTAGPLEQAGPPPREREEGGPEREEGVPSGGAVIKSLMRSVDASAFTTRVAALMRKGGYVDR